MYYVMGLWKSISIHLVAVTSALMGRKILGLRIGLLLGEFVCHCSGM